MMPILEERYGHVVARLLQCWGSPSEFEALFNDLMFDARGNRSGWPADVWEELQFLHKLHKLAYSPPEDKAEPAGDELKWV